MRAPRDAQDKLLFTPGPLTTSPTVKQAALRDLGSRDFEFINLVRDIRRRLVALGEVDEEQYTAVLVQGSGTYGLEAVVSSTIPPEGKLLVLVNGAYGKRVAKLARVLKIPTQTLDYAENQLPDPTDVARALSADPQISMVSICSCETTSGIFNPVEEVGEVVHQAGRTYFVDAMSDFGARSIPLDRCHIDYLVSSANKCIEGIPGFAFVLARREALQQIHGWARSLSLDLLAQHRGLEQDGQFRFTPPTHTLLAFHQALKELEQEGGVAGRARRYQDNHRTLVAGMRGMGFVEYLPEELQGHIITSFRYPDTPRWDFEAFYALLNEEGYVIYPGKVGDAPCFRIGSIGRIFPDDVRDLLAAIQRALERMGIQKRDNVLT